MELASGVKEYLDSLVNDDSNYVVLIYGSVASGRASDKSDIDVYVIGTFGGNSRSGMEIDCCELEVTFTDISNIYDNVAASIKDNNAYFESLLNKNIILKDSLNLVDILKEYLAEEKRTNKKSKKTITPRNRQLLNEFYKCFIQEDDLYSYFNLLDQIRMTLAYINNLSSLNIGKVYDMYCDIEHAKKDYCLTLPDDEFICQFDAAIRKKSDNERIKWLFESIGFNPSYPYLDCGYFKYCDNNRRKTILIHMDKMVTKAIRLLVQNNPYKDYVYYVVINHLYRFYHEIYGVITEDFIRIMDSAKVETDTILRTNYLKQLFELLEGKYAFDYKNYTLYFD